jgi:hypothetical protein
VTAVYPWANLLIALIAIMIAAIKVRLYAYLKTPYVLLLGFGFTYFGIIRILIALDGFKVITFDSKLSELVVGGGYVFLLIGSIGVFVFVKKAFIEAARLLREKGAALPDTWKNLDARVEKLKKDSDEKMKED